VARAKKKRVVAKAKKKAAPKRKIASARKPAAQTKARSKSKAKRPAKRAIAAAKPQAKAKAPALKKTPISRNGVPEPRPTPRPTPDMSGRSLLPLNILLIGPPGAGKGTQAEKICSTFGIPHLSTGNIFRAAIRAGTELGKKVEPMLAGGQLVPDAMVIPLVDERLLQPDVEHGCLFDGYPRTIPQADALGHTFERLKRVLSKVILIEVPDSTIVARMSGRRSCPVDGSVYHVISHPPREPGKCDKCGHDLVTRPDDLPETVQKRLDKYTQDTAPLIAYYEPKGVLARVDGKRTPDQVFAEIHQALQK
jgi:adenylate kinase